MSFAKMHTRKTMSFLTPQAKKTPARLSFGGKNGTPEKLLGGLLKDPIKRALLMEVLSQDTREDTEKPKVKTKNPQKFKFESPSALCRRRALEKMRANSDSSDNTTSPSIREQSMKEVPFDQILSGVIAYVEIKSNNMDRSAGAKALMQAMGAKIKDVLNRHVTHVVFKDGSFNTFQKAKLLKVHLVSVLWIEAVHKNRKRVPEKNYPALGAAASDADASFICKLFQQEYADVIQEELDKSNMFDVNQDEKITRTPHTIPRRKATRLFQRENHPGDLDVEMLQYKLMKRKDEKTGKGNGNSSDDFEETPQFLKRPNYKQIDLASQPKGIKCSKQNNVKEMFGTSTGRTIFKEPSGKIARRFYNSDDPIEGKCSKMNSLDSIKLTPINYKKNMKFTSCTTPRRTYTRLFQKDNYQDSIDQDTLLQDKSKKSSYGKFVKETGNSSDDFEETPNFLKRMRDKDFSSQRKRMKNDYPKQDVNESNTNAAEKNEHFKMATCRSPRLKDSQNINVNILSNIQISPARQSDSQRDVKGDEKADLMGVNSDKTMKEPSKKVSKKLYTLYDDVEDDRTLSKTHMIKPINYKPDMEFGSHSTPRRKSMREFQKGNYQGNIDKETLLQDRKFAKEVASSSDDFEETPSFLKKITMKVSGSPRKLRVKNDYTSQGAKETSFRSPKKPQDFKTPNHKSARFKDIPDINLNILKSFQISPPRQTSTFSDVKAIEMSDMEIKQLDNSLMLLNCI